MVAKKPATVNPHITREKLEKAITFWQEQRRYHESAGNSEEAERCQWTVQKLQTMKGQLK